MQTTFTPLRVVILDHSEKDAERMVEALSCAGFDPHWRRVDDESAYLAHLNPPPDVVLAEYNLPQLDALKALRCLREKYPGIPFIVVTGRGETAGAERLAQGADDYLSKDRLGRLGHAVGRALEQRRLSAELHQAAAALHECEERYHALFAGNPNPMWVVNRDTHAFLAVNESAIRDYGYSRAEFLSLTLKDIQGNGRTSARFALQPAMGSHPAGSPPGVELAAAGRHHKKDGTQFDVEVTSRPISFQGRDAELLLAIDPSERWQIEKGQFTQLTIGRLLAQCSKVEEATSQVLRAICKGFGFELGELWSVDSEAGVLRWTGLWHESVETEEFERMSRSTILSRGSGLPGKVWETGQSAWITLAGEPGSLRPSLAAKMGLLQAVAFKVGVGIETIGVISLFSRDVREPDSNVLAMLTDIGFQVGQFWESKRTEKAISEQDRLSSLRDDICNIMIENDTVENTLQRCAEVLVRHLDDSSIGVWVLNNEHGSLDFQAGAGVLSDRRRFQSYPPGVESRIARIVQTCRAELIRDINQDPLIDPSWMQGETTASFAGYPLVVDGKPLGAIALVARQPIGRAISKGVASIVDDIALGLRRKNAEEALRKTEELTQRIIESTNDGILVLDLEAKPLYLSPGGQRLLQLKSKNSLQEAWAALSEGTGKENALKALAKAKAGGTGAFQGGSPSSHGLPRWWDVSISPITDATRAVKQVVCVFRDITERRHSDVQLAQAQKLESIGQLAAGIAHEINTPIQYVGDNVIFLQTAFDDLAVYLQACDGMIGRLKDLAVAPDLQSNLSQVAKEADLEYLRGEIPRAIQQSLEGVAHVANIVKAMKEFSHPGGQEKTAVDINHAIQSTILVSRSEWKYVADLKEDFDHDLPLVPCLPGEFNQAILNLIINAAHAIADALAAAPGTKGFIAISTRREGDWVEIRVRDSGTGIPENIRSDIFNPFFTTKGVGKGTGQGLAIAHAAVVQRHGGTLSFETEVGTGTTFIIRLPLHEGPV